MLLRDKDRKSLVAIFNTVDLPLAVWAYGSRVNGGAHAGSDLDLVIRTADLQSLPVETYLAIKQKIQYSNIPIVVEIFDWARIPESFQQNILEKHEVLFDSIVG